MHITDFTQDGKCSSCGKCCSDILPLSNKEIKTIRKYVKQHNIKEQRRNYFAGLDLTCPFRDETNRKCLIYEVRPAICRVFICNATTEQIIKSRDELGRKNKAYFMRNTFFKGTTLKEFMEVMKNDKI